MSRHVSINKIMKTTSGRIKINRLYMLQQNKHNNNMKPYHSVVRTLSSKLSTRLLSSTPVSPWPVRTAFEEWFESELDYLTLLQPEDLRGPGFKSWYQLIWEDLTRTKHDTHARASHLARALDVAVIAHKKVEIDAISASDHLDEVADLLDACNALRERLDAIKRRAFSASVSAHRLGGERVPCGAVSARARAELDDAVGRRAHARLARATRKRGVARCEGDAGGALGASLAFGSYVCEAVSIALSPEPRWRERRRTKGDGSGAVLEELRVMVRDARRLREAVAGGAGEAEVGALRRSADELGRVVRVLEMKVDELYRVLVEVRMGMLDVISRVRRG
ncbi:hypothetical protein QJS04_geneDACA009101 [Acorus gramineus]|uniref:Uncharacterized protein n=1 Tax=Acorus gramineus TaxID=55184 RepID=A0AAV9ASE9_ACOGR|nr:hypothetical protein QJS04_geneDACA009101 [Acorus gramineus]